MYSPEILHKMMSINESFTNRAAACCLMPGFLLQQNLETYNGGKKVLAYEGYVLPPEQKLVIEKTANAMGVNYTPLFTRLKELDLFDIHSIDEYLNSEFYRGGEGTS